MAENYQKVLERQLRRIEDEGALPRLLLHSCCAPCSSYVLEYLSNHFDITVLYYNPNIAPQEEFNRRVEEQRRLLNEMPLNNPIKLVVGNYDADRFERLATGKEHLPEGGERCLACYRLRLEESAQYAAKHADEQHKRLRDHRRCSEHDQPAHEQLHG